MAWPWIPQIDPLKCTGCGECIPACPTGALGEEAARAILLHPDQCTYCTICEDLCPVDAIELPYLIVKESDLTRSQMKVTYDA